MKESKTAKALRLVKGGANPHAAAAEVGLAANAVYVALKKQRMLEEGLCPCCGQKTPIKEVKQ